MRKWGIAFSLLAVLLGLAACGGTEQEVNILPYYYGYITTDGVLFGDTDGVYSVLCDEQGKQLYVLKSQSVYDYHSFNEAGNYEVVGFVFSVYDKNGVLQQRFEVDDADGSREFQFESSVGLFLPSNLDLNKAVLLLDMLGPQGRFQLLRADGRLLAEEKLPVDYKTSSFMCIIVISGGLIFMISAVGLCTRMRITHPYTRFMTLWSKGIVLILRLSILTRRVMFCMMCWTQKVRWCLAA